MKKYLYPVTPHNAEVSDFFPYENIKNDITVSFSPPGNEMLTAIACLLTSLVVIWAPFCLKTRKKNLVGSCFLIFMVIRKEHVLGEFKVNLRHNSRHCSHS